MSLAAGFDRARRRAVGAMVIAVVAGLLAGCTIVPSGAREPTGTGQVSPGVPGSTPTIADLDEGAALEWNVSTPITASSVGLGESMVVVQPPGDRIDVELAFADGVWQTEAEQLTVQPRHGYVGAINLFRTLSGGAAVHEQLLADAEVLGFPREQIDRWLTELPSTLAEERTGGLRERTGINGGNGDTSISVQISHAPGPGGDESIRLWYAIGPPVPE